MSIKNDNWILRMCEKHNLIFPFVKVQKGGGIVSYGPSSFGYDVRAGYAWKIFTDVLGAVVDPKHQDERAFHTLNMGGSDEPIILPPNSYALTNTIETIHVPRNVTCLCIGKSTYARCGIHVNVTPLEAGWFGQVTVEISNGTRLPVKVYPGEGIMQVLFFEGEDPDVSYADRKGKYQDQKGIVLASVLDPAPMKLQWKGEGSPWPKETVAAGVMSMLEAEDAEVMKALNMAAAKPSKSVVNAEDRERMKALKEAAAAKSSKKPRVRTRRK